MCQPYGTSNIFFLVGTGSNPDLATNKLCLWDDNSKEFVAEVQFYHPIVDLKICGSWIVLADAEMCFVFNLEQESGMEHALARIPTRKCGRG